MAIYERTQRESAHVFSRVVDKSKVPSALNWAALGCVTASKGELNKVYQINSTDLLASTFGEPTTDHIALICADKIIAEDNTMFIIRVAHENSLRGAQVIVSTDVVYGGKGNEIAIGVVTGNVEDGNGGGATHNLMLHIATEGATTQTVPADNLKNIADDLSMDIVDDPILMENTSVTARYADVYQIDSKGNKSYSEELCLILSDVADTEEDIIVSKSPVSGQEATELLNDTQFEANWFFGDGYNKKTAIVLKPSANIVENAPCNVTFSIDQVAMRAYGTASPNKVTLPVVLRTNIEGGGDVPSVTTFSTYTFYVCPSQYIIDNGGE